MSEPDQPPHGSEGEAPSEAESPDQARVPIVGIGASAGGIEALKKLFRAMPGDSGLAFVVVQHLHPEHESRMSEVLRRDTTMPVMAVEEGVRIEPDHVYVIPPDRELTVESGILHLSKMVDSRLTRRPIDGFLTSLAKDLEEHAIGIILSGTGGDGTAGIRAIRAAGGLTVAQLPKTAGHTGMPESAIASGVVDAVLAPEDMPDLLQRYARHVRTARSPDVAEAKEDLRQGLNRLLTYVRTRTGHDFRSYKDGTVLRRINRRMGLCGARQFVDYETILREDESESEALVKDLLINVTGFFRDPKAWQALEQQVIAPLVREREEGGTIRAWVPACATGEEAYSVAILLAEQAEAAHKVFDIKIFATDPGAQNLDTARRGRFPATIERDVSGARLQRFFEQVDDAFEVKQELRDYVIFAPQNLLNDPPFFRIDLVSCRNFLIYLKEEAQRRAVRLFHFALRDGGSLFLGSAETVGRDEELFKLVSREWRIYQRVGPTRHDLIDFPVPRPRERDGKPAPERRQESGARHAQGPIEAAQRALAEHYAPASVLIDRRHRVLWFHGETERFLAQPSGEPTRDLFALTREHIRSGVRTAVEEAVQNGRQTTFSAGVGDGAYSVHGTVRPLKGISAEGLFLVSFEVAEMEAREGDRLEAPDPGDHRGSPGQADETELTSVRRELRKTVEELEASNEELKASNEEITSMNEELQVANEELESSKEELQSLNEELNSVNNQLQRKVEELEGTTNDLNNLLASSDVATLFLDRQLQIRWFSPAIEELIDVRRSDIGRPITHFATRFQDANLCPDAEAVRDRLVPAEAEVRTDDRWYLRRIVPYRTQDDRIDGVVVTFVDITSQKQDEEQLHAIFDAVRHPLLVLGPNLRVRSANASFYDSFPLEPADTERKLIFDLGDGQWDLPQLRRELSEVLPRDKTFDDFEVELDFVGLGPRTMVLSARQIDELQMILLSIEDVTERKRWEERQQMLLGELSHRVKHMLATVQAIAAQTARRAPDMQAFQRAFDDRLEALDAAHALLIDGRWHSVRLHAVLALPLRAYEAEAGERVRITGEDFALTPKAALAVSMVANELATNAAKYGALSTSSGRIEITTGLTESDLGQVVSITWRESGGPRVEPPSASGFGHVLVERSINYELDGETRIHFEPDGLRCTMLIPYNPDAIQTD